MNQNLLSFNQASTFANNLTAFHKYIYNTNLPVFEFLKFTNELMIGLLMGQSIISQGQIPCTHKYLLPIQKSKKKTLFLDIDETLISTKVPKNEQTHTVKITVNKQEVEIGFGIRPNVHEFLATMSQYYELILFTASKREYAQAISAVIDPNGIYITDVVSREYCLNYNSGAYIKDLRIFLNRDINNLLIVDNSSISYCLQPENGVPIIEWLGNQNDKELIGLASYLESIAKEKCSLREINSKKMQIKTLLECYQQRIY